MPRDAETLKIEGWARDGERADPEDARAPVMRSDGWPVEFQLLTGPPVERSLVNQVLHEITASLVEIHRGGIPEWDEAQDYEHFAFVRHGAGFYVSLRSSGPGMEGAVEPGSMSDDAWRPY